MTQTVARVFGIVFLDYYFLPPYQSFHIESPGQGIRFALFIAEASLID